MLLCGHVYSQTNTVPNTTTFSLYDVLDAVYGSHISGNLDAVFTASNSVFFDVTYGSKTMSPKTMLGFRNYHIPGCTRPTGLTNDSLYTALKTYPESTFTSFTTSNSSAKQAFFKWDQNIPTAWFQGISLQYSSMTTGQTIYLGSGTDCTTVPTGYYIWGNNNHAYITTSIVYIQAGVVQWVHTGVEIGDNIGGGIVACIFSAEETGYISNECRGLIMSPSNISTSAQWGCSGTSVSTSVARGTGQANTTAIVSACSTTGIAAKLCNDYSVSTYSDWFLLESDYLRDIIQKDYDNGTHKFTADVWYWASSQSSSTSAYIEKYSTGSGVISSVSSKSNSYYVMAFRSF